MTAELTAVAHLRPPWRVGELRELPRPFRVASMLRLDEVELDLTGVEYFG